LSTVAIPVPEIKDTLE